MSYVNRTHAAYARAINAAHLDPCPNARHRKLALARLAFWRCLDMARTLEWCPQTV